MSFAGDTRAELCRVKIDSERKAVAECCGILMFCGEFSSGKIKITTSNEEFAARVPKVFAAAFGISFDSAEKAHGRMNFVITDRKKMGSVYAGFGTEGSFAAAQHVNFALLEESGCRAAFVRGAFLSGGSVTDPEKGFHFELSTRHISVAGETRSVLQEMGFEPGCSLRGGNSVIYLKRCEAIADLLTAIGAPVAGMKELTAKVEKEMRNTVTRQINCDTANTDRTVAAAQEQIDAIKKYSARYGLDGFPEELRDVALLRITNPEASLAELARLSLEGMSKSSVSRRLRKITELASEMKDE